MFSQEAPTVLVVGLIDYINEIQQFKRNQDQCDVRIVRLWPHQLYSEIYNVHVWQGTYNNLLMKYKRNNNNISNR